MLVLGMLLSGTINTVVMKIQFTLHSVGSSGEDKAFSKPWYGTFNMLLAMALVLVVQQTLNGCQLCRGSKSAASMPLIDASDTAAGSGSGGKSYLCKATLTSIPAFFDLAATVLGCMGVLYIPASIFQMLRASTMVFAAFFSVVFLKRTLIGANYVGLALCVVGVCMVSVANLMDGGQQSDDSSKPAAAAGDSDAFLTLLGIGLTLSGQVVQAAQVIAEEWILKDVDLPPFEIIGYEGFWGIAMMLLVGYPLLWVLPGDDDGHVEDPFDTIVMIQNNGWLLLCFCTYLCSCATLNATGIAVTGALSGTMRMMLDALRTLGIWAFFLLVHLVDPTSPFGEKFTAWSWLQLAGFAVLVVGQAVYGEVLKLSFLSYPKADEQAALMSPAGAVNLASPLPQRHATPLDK